MNPTSQFACNVLSVFMALVAIIGNSLVSHVIVRLKSMKTSINYIILHLAIMDVITGVFTILYVFTLDYPGILGKSVLSQAYSHNQDLAHILCKVEWILWVPFNSSPLLLMIMAYERFKAIVHPLSRLDGTVSKAKLKWMLPLAWLLGMAYAVSEMIVIRFDTDSRVCLVMDLPSWYSHKTLIGLYALTQYTIPATAMLIFYGRVICALRRQDNALGPQAEAERARRKARKKVMWILVLVTLVFYICCGIPFFCYTWLILVGDSLLNIDFVLDINVVLMAFNSAFNPVVYFLFMKTFRDGFKRVFLSSQRLNQSSGYELNMNVRRQHSLGTTNEAINDE